VHVLHHTCAQLGTVCTVAQCTTGRTAVLVGWVRAGGIEAQGVATPVGNSTAQQLQSVMGALEEGAVTDLATVLTCVAVSIDGRECGLLGN